MSCCEKLRLKDTIVIVFGGNGDIGGAIAQGLCAEGATVIATGRNKERIRKINTSLKKMGNNWNECIPVDVTSRKEVESFVSKVVSRYKKIDCMICASGVYLNKPAEDVTDKEWNTVLDTNVNGFFITAQIVGRQMLTQNSGSIISIGSLGSFVALSNTIAYSVSKAAVVSMTRCLSSEWASRGVRVNSIVPGVFPTRLNKKALAMKGRKENILKGIPIKRLGDLSELVGIAVFLASQESSYVTGAAIPVDGGFLSFSGY